MNNLDKIKNLIEQSLGKAHFIPGIELPDDLVPGFKVSVRRIVFDPVNDAYPVEAGLALNGRSLSRLDHLAGLVWKPSVIRYDPSRPYICQAQAEGLIQDLDGTWRNATASRTVDLQDGSPDALALSSKSQRALQRARSNIAQVAETKAKNRVRRELLNLKPIYSREELEQPFIVLKLVPVIDMQDPAIKRMIAAQFIGAAGSLFGQSAYGSPTVGEYHQPQPMPAAVIDPIGSHDESWDEEVDHAEFEVETSSTATQPSDVTPVVEWPTPEEKRRLDLVAEVASLYPKKIKGGRSSKKPPLESLSIEELEAVRDSLLSKPDLK